MKSKKSNNAPELSRPLIVDKVPAGGIEEILRTDPKERAALAKRFDLIELRKLEAQLTVLPTRGGKMFDVEGQMQADVVQQCVVTLEPLPAHIEQAIHVLFASPELLESGASSPHVDVEGEETEAILHGVIDLGELVAQHLGIALDPYPRKPGLPLVEVQYGEGEEPTNPFAKLAELTKTGKKKE